MTVAYFEPLSRSWNRMTRALFKPFDLGKWFTIGFTAFLARLTQVHGGGQGNSARTTLGENISNLGDVILFPYAVRDWLRDHPQWFALIIVILLAIAGIVILLTWLSSRGKFMFLDNVVHDRAKVTQPWHEYRSHANSLFLWRLIFGLICLAVLVLILFQAYFLLVDYYENEPYADLPVMPLIVMGLLLLFAMLVIAYISLFLNNFVIPIMYKHGVSATRAWSQFLSLFKQHWIHFILFGPFMLLLFISAVIAIVTVGLFTCCIGILLLLIPYISSVVTLPISYTFTALGPEFLAQFGDDFNVFLLADATPVTS